MPLKTSFLLHASLFTSRLVSNVSTTRHKPTRSGQELPPSKPDWLLILTGILFLLTVLIAWLVDILALFR